ARLHSDADAPHSQRGTSPLHRRLPFLPSLAPAVVAASRAAATRGSAPCARGDGPELDVGLRRTCRLENGSSAALSSSALWKRRFGSSSRQRMIAAPSARGRPG